MRYGTLGEKMLQKVKTDLQSRLPLELVDALLLSYEEIKQNFYLGKHEPSELNGGKFVEACFRILQYETNAGNYTPVGAQIRNLIGKLRDFEQIPTASAIDSFRIHIPRTLVAMYNIRNKRGVGHLGGDVNPNRADASLLVACAGWVMAELFRIYYQCSLEEAQMVVDALVQRRLSLVHELEDTKRVLLPSLSYKDPTLLLLASEFPDRVSEADLLVWIEPKDKSDYRRRILRTLHSERMIEYDEPNWCRILPTGLRYVESQYSHWLNKLSKEE
jgi:hypothetical protein